MGSPADRIIREWITNLNCMERNDKGQRLGDERKCQKK